MDPLDDALDAIEAKHDDEPATNVGTKHLAEHAGIQDLDPDWEAFEDDCFDDGF